MRCPRAVGAEPRVGARTPAGRGPAVPRPPSGTALAGLECLTHTATGARLQLVRAWPGNGGTLTLELRAPDGSLAAARWPHDCASQVPTAVSRDGRLVRLYERGEDPRLPALAALAGRRGARLLVHRAGRRGVVRLADGTYAKVVRPARLAAVVAAASRAASLTGEFTVAQPLEVDERGGALRCAALRGVALHDALGDRAAATAAGAALRSLHDCAVPATLATHDAMAEARVTDGWIARLTGALLVAPGTSPDASAGAAAARRALDLAPSVRAALLWCAPRTASGLVHRDLHDKQILVEGDRVGLLDFDTLAHGEPALDLANLLVHIELRALQGHCDATAARSTRDALLAGYRPDDALVDRLKPYAAAAWLRLACVYAFRPVPHGLLEALLARVQRGQ